ncbi:MAG: ABC transporter ATP-binding protein [Chloroflexi bacterium]|nr:ABC transporter ATP-binding protein [Chloroflexota bacterium]
MIETWNLTKRFGSFGAVNGLSIRVEPGQILALLGPNGAGKTTTTRMLSAILMPTYGKAIVCGYNVVEEARAVRSIMGLLTEVPGLYTRMNGLDYLEFFGRLQGVHPKVMKPRIEGLLVRFGLWEHRHRLIGTYSKGMRQKLALLRAIVHDPRVLYLDEPTSAMDPYSAKLVRDFISDLRRDDRTIVICTHNLAEAEMLADRIAIINRGRIIAEGAIDDLKRRLLGPPRYKLNLATPLIGLLTAVDGTVRLEETGDTWVCYSTPNPEATNPALLRRLVEAGAAVESLSQMPRSLEEVYLSIVEEP